MNDIFDIWHKHLTNVIKSIAEAGCTERDYAQLVQDAETARLQRQIEEDKARAEFLQLTREELVQFRIWLQERSEHWECER